jgi:hypothetical protein
MRKCIQKGSKTKCKKAQKEKTLILQGWMGSSCSMGKRGKYGSYTNMATDPWTKLKYLMCLLTNISDLQLYADPDPDKKLNVDLGSGLELCSQWTAVIKVVENRWNVFVACEISFININPISVEWSRKNYFSVILYHTYFMIFYQISKYTQKIFHQYKIDEISLPKMTTFI